LAANIYFKTFLANSFFAKSIAFNFSIHDITSPFQPPIDIPRFEIKRFAYL